MWKVWFIFLVEKLFSILLVWNVWCNVIFVFYCFYDCCFLNLNILAGDMIIGFSERRVCYRVIRSLKKLCKFFLLASIKLPDSYFSSLVICMDMLSIFSGEAYDIMNLYFLFVLFSIKVFWVLLALVLKLAISILFLSHH